MNDTSFHHLDSPATPGVPLDFDLARGVSMRFRPVPAGSFFLGQRGVRAEEEPVPAAAKAQ